MLLSLINLIIHPKLSPFYKTTQHIKNCGLTLTQLSLKHFAKTLDELLPNALTPHFLVALVNPSIPYFFALSKTYRQGVLIRPIISSCSSVTRPLDSWIGESHLHFISFYDSLFK